MNDHPTNEKLIAYLDGSADQPADLAIESHLGDCRQCCEFLANHLEELPLDPLLREIPEFKTAAQEARKLFDPRSSLSKLEDRFDIKDELGRGATSVVYRAFDKKLKRTVALKYGWQAYPNSRDLNRFLREAEAIASLQHPNIVEVYEVTECQGHPCMILELLEAGALDGQLSTGCSSGCSHYQGYRRWLDSCTSQRRHSPRYQAGEPIPVR